MAEKKTKEKTTKVKDEYQDLTLNEARKALQKLKIQIIEGKETDTSKVRKLKSVIARILTKNNS